MRLLDARGRDAVTTRAVADAAAVQPPVLYRLFGDKDGLLQALAEYGFAAYLAQKHRLPTAEDPVNALRTGWDLHVEFGLGNPSLYRLMYAEPPPGTRSTAAEASFRILRAHLRAVALSGRLRVKEEDACQLLHAAGSGTVLSLLQMPEQERDPALSRMAREAVLAAVTSDLPHLRDKGSVGAAISLRASLDETVPLTDGERSLLIEWLDRIARQGSLR